MRRESPWKSWMGTSCITSATSVLSGIERCQEHLGQEVVQQIRGRLGCGASAAVGRVLPASRSTRERQCNAQLAVVVVTTELQQHHVQ